jgi:hypothetical protein
VRKSGEGPGDSNQGPTVSTSPRARRELITTCDLHDTSDAFFLAGGGEGGARCFAGQTGFQK